MLHIVDINQTPRPDNKHFAFGDVFGGEKAIITFVEKRARL